MTRSLKVKHLELENDPRWDKKEYSMIIGQWGLCHQTIGILEIVQLNKFQKIAQRKGFFDFFVILCITIHFHVIKSSIFTKMGKLVLNDQNFSKISAPVAPKKVSLWPIFPIFGRVRVSPKVKNAHPLVHPPNSIPG